MPITDARLTHLADSPQPAWLWSADGEYILWSNPSGRTVLRISGAMAQRRSPADPHGRQIAALARRLPADGTTRLERLRGFGARLGGLMTCACSRFDPPDGRPAILLVAMDSTPVAARFVVPAPASVNMPAQSDTILDQPLTEDATSDIIPMSEDANAELPPMAQTEHIVESASSSDIAARPDSIVTERVENVAAAGTSEIADLRHPLRFVWQTDPAGAFSIAEGDFLRLAGERTTALLGQSWRDVAAGLGLDPQNQIAHALDARETWSGIALRWPIRAADTAHVLMSGIPVFDSSRNFSGYRGFGICRLLTPDNASPPTESVPPALAHPSPEVNAKDEPQSSVAPNVVPFRPATDARGPSLSPVENNAFDEIARRLAEGLDARPSVDAPDVEDDKARRDKSQTVAPWLEDAITPPSGDSARDKPLLDLLPTGVLIYGIDRLLHATPAFLSRTGFADLQALQQAGGLDALFIEPGSDSSSSRSENGLPLKVAAAGQEQATVDARLFSIVWDGESAHALILSEQAPASPDTPSSPIAAAEANISAILDAATDSVVLFDRSGAIGSANRSAEQTFGYTAIQFAACNLTDLLAAESQHTVLEYFESIDGDRYESRTDHGREITGLTRQGHTLPLSMTMGRTGPEQFFAVFRDLSGLRKNEADLFEARRRADHAISAKTEALAAMRRDIRDPLNSILAFASSMLEGRFGQIADDRFEIALRDIHGSAERVLLAIGEAADRSRTETDPRELDLSSQDLNATLLQSVGELQAQATRRRIIIRTSLAGQLPHVLADAQALRQIAANVVANAIRLSKPGGQIIVSTTASASGAAVLRVRDTAPNQTRTDTTTDASGIAFLDDQSSPGFSLVDFATTKALVAANQAQFDIRQAPMSGTLIEITFAKPRAMAG